MGNPEKEIAEAVLKGSGLSASKLGLRFDKVVVRVLGDLRGFAEETLPDGATAVVTITAPIHVPGRTVEALREGLGAADWDGDVHGNAVRVRRMKAAAGRPKLVGFVHNPDSDATGLLDLAERWLRT